MIVWEALARLLLEEDLSAWVKAMLTAPCEFCIEYR
jgi:hypothetical protein